MGWTVGSDLAAHRTAVGPFLASHPVEHTTQATILDTLATGVSWSDTPPTFVVHRDDAGVVDGAAVTTPPHPLVLDTARAANDPNAPADLVDPAHLAVALGDLALPGVNAPEPVAEAFAAAWCGPRGSTARPDLRLHLLGLPRRADLRPPPDPGGVVRPATPADLPAVARLVSAMRAEIGEHGASPEQILRDRIAAGLVCVLAVGDDLVATAQTTPAVAGVSRVAGVYTVPTGRGRGYAAAVTAAVTVAAFDAGAEHVCLFTDAANPTSNGVYERLGYVRRPVDRVVLRFEPR